MKYRVTLAVVLAGSLIVGKTALAQAPAGQGPELAPPPPGAIVPAPPAEFENPQKGWTVPPVPIVPAPSRPVP